MYSEIDKIVWHKAEQYHPLTSTIFALMVSLSMYENSMCNINTIDYHILVEDYN